MTLASTSASRWAVSARTGGEVLTAGISRAELELVVLGVPAGFSHHELESWLHDLAGVAVETSRADDRQRAIPALLHHALTGLLFSHAELWDRLDTPRPCSCAFVDRPEGAALGWIGEARVHVLVNGDPVEPQWVLVRDDEGREARAAVFAPDADVVVTLEYRPNGDEGGGAPASLEAEWLPERPESGDVPGEHAFADHAAPVPPAPVDVAMVEEAAAPEEVFAEAVEAVARELPESLPVQQPGLAAHPYEQPGAAEPYVEAEPAPELEASDVAEAVTIEPDVQEEAGEAPVRDDEAPIEAVEEDEAPPAPKPQHPVARWLARVMGFGRRAPRENEPVILEPVEDATAPVSAYDGLLSEPAHEQTEIALPPTAGAPAPPQGLQPAGIAEILGAAGGAPHADTPSGAFAVNNQRLQDLLAEIEAADSHAMPVISPEVPAGSAGQPLEVDHEPVGAHETFAIPPVPRPAVPPPSRADEAHAIPPLPAGKVVIAPVPRRYAEVSSIPPVPAAVPQPARPAASAEPSAPVQAALPAEAAASEYEPIAPVESEPLADAVAAAPIESEPEPIPPVELATEQEAIASAPEDPVEPVAGPRMAEAIPDHAAIELEPAIAAAEPATAATEPAAVSAPSPAAEPDPVPWLEDRRVGSPGPRRARTLEAPEERERPKVAIHRRPVVWAIGVVLVFLVGWLVGGLANPSGDHGGPLVSALRAIGLGPARFTVNLDTRPGGAHIEIDGKPQATRTPATLELPPGEHTVKFLMPGLGGVTVPLKGRGGEKLTISESLNGTLDILDADANVPISVSIDGRNAGYAPLKVESIEPGLHEIHFSGPGMPAWVQTVEVGVRGSAQLVARPMSAPANGIIQVQATINDEAGSAPLSGAQVYVDGDLRGVTPLSIELPRGPHSLRVAWRGEAVPVQVIDLPGGNQRFASFQFGLDAPVVKVEPVGDVRAFAAGQASMLSAAISGMAASDLGEAWLRVRTGEGLWRRYSMTPLRSPGQLVVAAVFPDGAFDRKGETQWYVSVTTRQGDEYFSEIRRSTLAGGGKPAARP